MAIDYKSAPFDEAISFLESRIALPSQRWNDFSDSEANAAFWSAGADASFVGDLQKSVTRAIQNGVPYDSPEFAAQIAGFSEQYGWDIKGSADWRARLILSQNLRQSYAAGRHDQQFDPDVMKLQPYLQYLHSDSRAPRPAHVALDGKVFRKDDPIVSSIYPPNGFNCFPDGTLIATPDGWQAIEKLKEGDLAFGGSGDIEPIRQVHTRFFDGELITIGIGDRECSATPNHRFLTQRGWIRADALEITDVIAEIINLPSLNGAIHDVNQVQSAISNFNMSLPVDVAPSANTFNPQINTIDLDINPVRADIEIKTALESATNKQINQALLGFGWFSLGISMKARVFSKMLSPSLSAFFHDGLIEKARRFFQLFRSSSSTFIISFIFTKPRMVLCLLLLRQFIHKLTGNLPPLRISDKLDSSSLALVSSQAMQFKQFHDSSRIHFPAIAKLINGHVLPDVPDVEELQGFLDRTPFGFFDSSDDFLAYTLPHCRFNPITKLSKTLYTGNVRNLTLSRDESYCVTIGIAHNCGCTMIALSQRQLDRKGLEVESIKLGETLPYVDSNGQTKQAIIKPDDGFNAAPSSNAEQRQANLERIKERLPKTWGKRIDKAIAKLTPKPKEKPKKA